MSDIRQLLLDDRGGESRNAQAKRLGFSEGFFRKIEAGHKPSANADASFRLAKVCLRPLRADRMSHASTEKEGPFTPSRRRIRKPCCAPRFATRFVTFRAENLSIWGKTYAKTANAGPIK